ncbi:MAG TPA: glycosyltransferase family 87 protein [Stellaceae bacterium]|jgi:hypothetical protein|nr:glycosyltransferase family 87 protein [Stellaceae bacterium]
MPSHQDIPDLLQVVSEGPARPIAAGPCLSRRQWLGFGIVCSAVGLVAWAFYLWAFHGDPGQDWMVFYTAARAYFDGNLPLIFDGDRLTAALNQRFGGWLAFTLNLHPWVYPPFFLLLFLPFGFLPPVASFAVFQLTGFIAALAAAGHYVGRGIARWIVAFTLVLCPAVPFNVMTGQNAFFTSALLVGGFGLLGRYPVLAGVLLGVLTFKPQLWLMVPVALLAARQWRALCSTAVTALVLVAASLAVFGPGIWQAWIGLLTGGDTAYNAWVVNGRLNGLSVFACVSIAGAPRAVANLVQAAAVFMAAGVVYWVYRREVAGLLPLAALLAATMLAAPHASASDAVMLGLAAAMFVAAPRRAALRTAELALAVAVWISPLLNPPSVFRAGCFTPVLTLLLLAAIVTAMRQRELPVKT